LVPDTAYIILPAFYKEPHMFKQKILLITGGMRIPEESCHPFRRKPATESGTNLPGIPA
jgi:hypothetical protein